MCVRYAAILLDDDNGLLVIDFLVPPVSDVLSGTSLCANSSFDNVVISSTDSGIALVCWTAMIATQRSKTNVASDEEGLHRRKTQPTRHFRAWLLVNGSDLFAKLRQHSLVKCGEHGVASEFHVVPDILDWRVFVSHPHSRSLFVSTFLLHLYWATIQWQKLTNRNN